MMMHDGQPFGRQSSSHLQWMGQPAPPAAILEERVLELEQLGLSDDDDFSGEPSSVRLFATVSLLHKKPPYFVTFDEDLLLRREILEVRYGMEILSIPEAIMLLRDLDGPPN